MTRNARTGIWVAVALVWAAGIALTVRSVQQAAVYRDRLERRGAELEQLQRIDARWRADREAVARFEALPTQRPEPLSDLLKQTLPGLRADIRQRESRNVWPGWTLQRMDVMFDDMTLLELGTWIERVESQRPPWRITECSILISDRSPGAARVTLVMEALEFRAR